MDFQEFYSNAMNFVLDPAVQDLCTKILVGLAAIGAGVKGLCLAWKTSRVGVKGVAKLFQSPPPPPPRPPEPASELCLGLLALLEGEAKLEDRTSKQFANGVDGYLECDKFCANVRLNPKKEVVGMWLDTKSVFPHLSELDRSRVECRVWGKIEECKVAAAAKEKAELLKCLPCTQATAKAGDTGEWELTIDDNGCLVNEPKVNGQKTTGKPATVGDALKRQAAWLATANGSAKTG